MWGQAFARIRVEHTARDRIKTENTWLTVSGWHVLSLEAQSAINCLKESPDSHSF